jgi:iron-sulfur cluster insertion protein
VKGLQSPRAVPTYLYNDRNITANKTGSSSMNNALESADLAITSDAEQKMNELFTQVDDDIQGIRVFAQPGGCSGMNFGMTFADAINADDLIREHAGFKVIVDSASIEQLRGAEVDFIDRGDGNPAFVFNNIPRQAGGGCGTCGSQGGGCG